MRVTGSRSDDRIRQSRIGASDRISSLSRRTTVGPFLLHHDFKCAIGRGAVPGPRPGDPGPPGY
eukprot:140741-Hanusia_phi.AAC.1